MNFEYSIVRKVLSLLILVMNLSAFSYAPVSRLLFLNLLRLFVFPSANMVMSETNSPIVTKTMTHHKGNNPMTDRNTELIMTSSPPINPLTIRTGIPYCAKNGLKSSIMVIFSLEILSFINAF